MLASLWSPTVWQVARLLVALGVILPVVSVSPARGADTNAPGFSFDTLREMARALAAKDFRPSHSDPPDAWKKMTYDQYQQIHFRPDSGPWNGEPVRFSFQFFHRGFIYSDPVQIHLVEQGAVHDYPFSQAEFDYAGKPLPDALPPDTAFAGLRVLYPVNLPQKQDEVASFLGASYFRVLGRGQRFGASLRGLAIDTAEPDGEEFPRFTDFWLDKPADQARQTQLFALLDSPSVAGAYRFVIKPGDVTVIDVEASLFARKGGKKFGFAPMSSMFLEGQNRTRFMPDFRPQVHDSDGLLTRSGQTNWQWRPLVNPDRDPQVTRISSDNLDGFGLLQRDRKFDDYEDLESHYELRPSYWIEPAAPWGPGSVELVEIPTASEWNDNIVAYWVPKNPPAPGRESRFAYRLFAMLSGPPEPLMHVRATLVAPAHDDTPPHFVVDFTGPDAGRADEIPGAKTSSSRGTVRNLVVETNSVDGGWRAAFDLTDTRKDNTDLSLFLMDSKGPISETWTYRYP